MTREEMLQDLAYARSVAEEGRRAPLLGGAYLMFWGVLNALAFAAHWGISAGVLPLAGGFSFAALWIGYGIVAFIGMTFLRMRTRGKPGLTTIGARAERALWAGAAIALMAIVIGSIGRMVMTGDPAAPNTILGGAFALYGAALFGTASLSQHTWLRAFGWLSVSVAMTLTLFSHADWPYLVAAVGSLLGLALPGFVLLQREPAAIE